MPKGSWREFQNSSETSELDRPVSIRAKIDRQVRVQKMKSGKGGKIVTVISGLELELNEARSLLKRLKGSCGTGGTVKGELLELQGDQVATVLDLLGEEGFRPKKSGG